MRTAAARDFTAHKRGGGGKENIHKKWSSVQRGKGPTERMGTWGQVPTKIQKIHSHFSKQEDILWAWAHFGKRHFGTDISSRRFFGTCTFWPHGYSVIRLGDFSAQGHFGTGVFRHTDISAHGHFGTGAWVPKYLCQNVHIAVHGAEMCQCRVVLKCFVSQHSVIKTKHLWSLVQAIVQGFE